MRTFGLVGKNIDYSFSRKYFSKKFEAENIPAVYRNFDLQDITEFENIFREEPSINGLNVTIPYKEKVIPYLDDLDPVAANICAVNTIHISTTGRLTGYNTDHYGFTKSLKPLLKPHHKKALILGTGGASKAVAYGLTSLEIPFVFVSREPREQQLSYDEISREIINSHQIIINCTPLGTFPEVQKYPALPVDFLNSSHLLYDLIYNPPRTELMKRALAQGATLINGGRMLELQAEKAWSIWNYQP